MKQTHSVAELKAEARETMLGKYGTAIALAFVTEGIAFVIALACDFMIDNRTLFGAIVMYLIQFIITLVMYIFSVGTCRFYLNICEGRPFNISDLFYGFRHNPDKAILTGLAIMLLGIACFLPFIGCIVAYILRKPKGLILAATLALIFAIVASVYFMLTYAFAITLIADDRNDLSVMGLLKESRRLMSGNRLRYFYMLVSFLGWLLLGLLTCGIAYLWIMPYINCTSTLFYLDICGKVPFDEPEIQDIMPVDI